MADNGKITRNGAEIQIDENGNVVARPAAGQEFIVEDDAVVGTLEAESVSTDSLGIEDYLTSASDHSELDAALNEMSGGWIILGQGSFSGERDIDVNSIRVSGTGSDDIGGGTRIRDDWEVSGRGVSLEHVSLDGGNITLSETAVQLHGIQIRSNENIDIESDRVVVSHVTGSGGDITFSSGTSAGAVGIISGNTSVTDNGNNNIL